jgi:hypothetical protein
MATRGRPCKALPAPDIGHAAGRLTHGLLSTRPVLTDIESEEDWQAHLKGFLDSLAPADRAEHVLACRIALTSWRLNRIIPYELSVLSTHKVDPQASKESRRKLGENAQAGAPELALPSSDDIELIERYETSLHAIFLTDIHELEALRAIRLGLSSPLAPPETD